MTEQPFGDRHGPTPDEMRRAFDARAHNARTAIPPRTEPSRYDQLDPLARALVDDYDALDLAEMLVKAQDELAALLQVARGYCPASGRGDAAPSVDDWEQQRQRADSAEAKVADYENRITWHTTCGSCARVLDSSIRETERAERAEEAARRALVQRQEMAAERYAWQERGDRAEAALARVRALVDECEESGHSSGHPLTVTRIRNALNSTEPTT